jgi:hypothetical protein
LGQLKASSTGIKTINLNSTGVSLVQSWVNNPATNQGIIIKDYSGPTNGLHLDSREASTATLRPKLTITYQPSSSQSSVESQANLKTAEMPLNSASIVPDASVEESGLSTASSSLPSAASAPASQPRVSGGQAVNSSSRRSASAARSLLMAGKVSNSSSHSFEILTGVSTLKGSVTWQPYIVGGGALARTLIV